jgi:hypothetical protein
MKRSLRHESSHHNSASNIAFHPAQDLSAVTDSPPRSLPHSFPSDDNYSGSIDLEEREREKRYRSYAGNDLDENYYDEQDENNYRRGAGSEGLALPLYHQGKGTNRARSPMQGNDFDMRSSASPGQETTRRRMGNASPGSATEEHQFDFNEKEPLNERSVQDEQGKIFGSKGFGVGPRTGGRRGIPLITSRKPDSIPAWIIQNEEWFFTLIYTVLALFTRLYRIGRANYVVWDEAHFGKFGSHYINRDFYFDVHPPLGKMLVGLAGLLSGYNGGFEFKSGTEYPADVPYTAMRVLLAMFGVGMVPIAWWTAGELGWTRQSRHFVTLCVLLGKRLVAPPWKSGLIGMCY